MAAEIPPISRRAFLATTVTAALAACTDGTSPGPLAADTPGQPIPTAVPRPSPTTTTEPQITTAPTQVDLVGDPFTLGVASGDPTPESVILWTRLAPTPLEGGAMPDVGFEVTWEISNDDSFDTIVSSGTERAVPGLAHSVHVDGTGLDPDTWYSYRFRLGQYTSTVGRTRTLPAPNAQTSSLRFGFSSCQNWEAGFYAAHRHLAGEELDLMIWLGDYIYENGPTGSPIESADGEPRRHNSPEITDLAGYRNRYALYKTDPDLQLHHATRPWLITWDDHEVENDYAAATSEKADPVDQFLARRAAAYQAWYEHMPVRLDPPAGPDYKIYRDFVWGDLAQFFVLDGRQYRGDQPTDGQIVAIPGFEDGELPVRTLGPTALDPEHRYLGREQETWMRDGVNNSDQTWKVLAQQVFMHGMNIFPGQNSPVTVTDSWDGYFANRQEILQGFVDDGVENLVVLTGDFHSATVGDLRADPYDLSAPVVGTEFMATSISSSFPQAGSDAAPLILAFNPQIKFLDPEKGYTVCEVTPSTWTATFRSLANARDVDSAISTVATFIVDSGTAGARPA